MLHTVPPKHNENIILFTQCEISWSQKSQVTFTIMKLIFLYTGPLIFMSVAYWQIVKVLWKSDIPGHNCKQTISFYFQIIYEQNYTLFLTHMHDKPILKRPGACNTIWPAIQTQTGRYMLASPSFDISDIFL